jgi:hypothetical protein
MKRTIVLLIAALLAAGAAAAQPAIETTGVVSIVISDGSRVLNQVDNAAWKIEPGGANSADSAQFTLNIYTVPGDVLADGLTLMDIPIDLETGAYSVASIRGAADLYAAARVEGSPTNPLGALTVEAVDTENGTFSGSFDIQAYEGGSDSAAAATITGTITDLPIIPLEECRTSGTNVDELFTFRVDGSAVIDSFDLPPQEGAWIAQTRLAYNDAAPDVIDLTLQDRQDSADGLRLEITGIPLDNPAGSYSADPDDEQYVVISLNNRGAFQLNLADDGTLSLTVSEEDGTLSGEFEARIHAADATTEAVITGSFSNLPLPTRICTVQNYKEPAA